jgi:hypothetical protein
MKKKTNPESLVRGVRISILASLPALLLIPAGANSLVVFIASLVLAFGIFKAGMDEVKPPFVGVVFFLGARTERKMREGICWTIPLLERIDRISLAPKYYTVGNDDKFFIDAINSDIGEDGAEKDEILQMICAYLVTIKADPENAEKTLDLESLKDLETNVVSMSKEAVRHFGSINSYQELMANLKETKDEMDKCLDELRNYLEKYGYYIENFSLSKMTPKNSAFRDAAESKSREVKEREGEIVQQDHFRKLVLAEIEASKDADGKPTLSYERAKEMVQVDLKKAKGIVISGSGSNGVILGSDALN